MSDDNNPEEKPSFFDSVEESKSWPPSDNYEIEKDPVEDTSAQSFFAADEFESPIPIQKNEATVQANSEDFLDSDDFLDQLIDNVDEKTNINNMRIVDDEVDEEDFRINQEPIIEPEPISPEEIISNRQETDLSYEKDLESGINIENIVNENEFQEAVADEDFDLDDLIEDDFTHEAPKEESLEEDLFATNIGSTGMGFTDDPEGITNSGADFASEIEEEFTGTSPGLEEQNYQTQTSFEDGYAESEFVDFVDENSSSELKPFRTFTKINLAQELAEEKEDEEETGIFAGMNKNILIVLAVIMLSLAYFLFNVFFNKKIETKSRQRRRPPKKEKIFSRNEQVLTPVWEISSQKTINPSLEDKYAKSLINFTGRENPFAMPQSVIDALKRQSDLALLAKKKPNTFKRMAYRATLLGVLSSEDSTIALVNMQEADFDVIEGTTKTKVLKLATKSMDKAKKNTLEMGRGSFIGPWEIVDVSAPKGAFSDAKITVEFQGTQKVLSMGKAEDLGIFDPAGQIDNLESTENEFEDDDF